MLVQTVKTEQMVENGEILGEIQQTLDLVDHQEELFLDQTTR